MKSRGITLIALVVTVVILLILAGVAIAMLIGPDGTIQKAKDSEIASRYSIILDRVKLRESDLSIKYKLKENMEDDTQTFIDQLTAEGLFNPSIDNYNEDENSLQIGKIGDTDNYLYTVPLPSFGSKKDMIVIAEATTAYPTTRIGFIDCFGLQVDWGDGNITEITEENSTYDDGWLGYITDLQHTYVTPGTYEIRIIGKCSGNRNFIIFKLYEIKKLKQWGENGFTNIMYNGSEGFSEQTEIPLPTTKSFEKLEVCYNLFNNSNITSIPEELFKNAEKLQSVRGLFSNCTNLTSIPPTLLDNSPNIIDFSFMFRGCTNLEGNTPEWWNRNPELSRSQTGACFKGCNNLDNYDDIPLNWIKDPYD